MKTFLNPRYTSRFALQKTRARFFAAALLLFSFLLGSCVREQNAPDTLQLAMSVDPSTLDPAKAYDTSSIQFVRLLYRGLVDYDDRALIAPEVAQSYQVSPDGKTYTFKLRPDVNFVTSEGKIFRRVEAEDFRFALERVLDPATASDGLSQYTMIDGAEEYTKALSSKKPLSHVRGIEVLDKNTIRFRLKAANATFLNYLALPFAYAVPRDYVKSLSKDRPLSENPLGCGSFLLSDWQHDGWLQLKKNPHYFRRDLPRTQQIDVQIGVSPTLQTMMFEQGRTDLLSFSDVSAPEFLRLKRDPKWKKFMLHAPMMDVRYVTLNVEMKPFTDVRVRRAMNHAINRDRIVSFLAGRATKARGALPPGMPAYNARGIEYSYDPQKARELLKEAGYEKGFGKPVTLWYSVGEPWYGMAAQSIQQDLRKVGVEIQTQSVRYAELKAKAGQRKNVEMAMMGWLQDFTDPSNFLDNLFNGRSITDTASINRAFYSDAQVNKLLDTALAETNRASRMKMYSQAEAKIVSDAPMVFLHHTERYVAHQPWIENYTLHPMWNERFEFVKVNDAAR